jgi:hypothetical protein
VLGFSRPLNKLGSEDFAGSILSFAVGKFIDGWPPRPRPMQTFALTGISEILVTPFALPTALAELAGRTCVCQSIIGPGALKPRATLLPKEEVPSEQRWHAPASSGHSGFVEGRQTASYSRSGAVLPPFSLGSVERFIPL